MKLFVNNIFEKLFFLILYIILLKANIYEFILIDFII